MIRVFTVTAPLSGDGQAAQSVIESAMDSLLRLYPPLLGADVTVADDVATVTIRVSARDQWACFAAARKIGTNMLLRLKVPADQGRLELVGTMPPATTLTKERGRNVSGHRPRGAKPPEAV